MRANNSNDAMRCASRVAKLPTDDPVEALTDGTVVSGTAVFLAKAQSMAAVIVCRDHDGEDAAVIAAVAIKDVVSGTRDPLLVGNA